MRLLTSISRMLKTSSHLHRRKLKFLLAVLVIVFVVTRIRLHFIIIYETNARQVCPPPPRAIAEIINKTRHDTTFEEIEADLSNLPLRNGGIHHRNKLRPRPTESVPFGRHLNRGMRIAVIVPYRDRRYNLNLFLRYMHPFLQRQDVTYGIYLVEPLPQLKFNRALLMNIGFIEASKAHSENWNCFVFHDVDMLPENDSNIYSCYDKMPKQMAVAVSTYNYRTKGYFEEEYFGGVNAFTKKQMLDINGFSNSYFLWGGEDDDARIRVLERFPGILRLDPDEGRYYAKCHEFQAFNDEREKLVQDAVKRMDSDGLSSLDYRTVRVETRLLFTRILVSYNDGRNRL